jgi:hypothetical protein
MTGCLQARDYFAARGKYFPFIYAEQGVYGKQFKELTSGCAEKKP